jgi:hypothetical protein
LGLKVDLVEELLEVNIKDEASHLATVDAPQSSISDIDVTEDVVADEFLVLDEKGEEVPSVNEQENIQEEIEQTIENEDNNEEAK